MIQFTAGKEHAGKRLDHALQQQLAQFSRSRLQDWIRQGRVRVNGAPQRPSHLLRENDRVEVEPAEPPPLHAVAEDIPLAILYEDDEVVAIDKPAGMVVHAGAGVRSGTLTNALVRRFGALSTVGGALRPGIVHRLDRYTSGVLLVARNDSAHRALAEQFARREVEKTYLALVHGEMKAEQGRIEKPIARDPVRRVRMTARLGRGRAAVTEWRALRRFRGFTLLEVRIGTGRTHQIRVHLSNAGHPVAGDRMYGAPARERFFLHAHRVRFRQPSSGKPVEVVSPLPPDLRDWLDALPL